MHNAQIIGLHTHKGSGGLSHHLQKCTQNIFISLNFPRSNNFFFFNNLCPSVSLLPKAYHPGIGIGSENVFISLFCSGQLQEYSIYFSPIYKARHNDSQLCTISMST